EEEIGLAADRVEVVGFLDPYQTVTGFLVTPVVAILQLPFTLTPDPFEVAEVFEVPLEFILNPDNHQRRSRMFNGQRREFYVLPYRDYYVWGATAAMLVNLYGKLAALEEANQPPT
ncbi:MAG: CoA pyrophosphatase, partial [Candidatus Competibacteraceae bacterium]|nr:CoA pyrophosphatase [Candidatus Competibacteraceae bacterium]